MPSSAYKRFKDNYAAIVATLALFVALGGTAVANSGLITGKQIKNGSITSTDIKKAGLDSKVIGKNAVTAAAIKANAVNSEEIQNDAVTQSTIAPDAVGTQEIGANAVTSEQIGNGDIKSADIGDGEVKPEDITEPAPVQITFGSAIGQVGDAYGLVAQIGTYSKSDPSSILSVSWTGTTLAPTQSCVFQLRVDGQPAPDSAGLVFDAAVSSNSVTNVATNALFPGLATGPHTVEVWARAITGGTGTDPCIMGPAEAGIPQTFVVSEELT
jgi:hypothetical protein